MSTTPVQGPGVTYTRVWLLFTFVTNQAGFDTGITIANISLDPLGTKPNQGGAYLHFYGINAPEKVFTGAIAPGAMWVNTAQTIAPGFQGYVIAECRSEEHTSELQSRQYLVC